MEISIYTGEEVVKVPPSSNNRCMFCGEKAEEILPNGMQLCGIKGNHPVMEDQNEALIA